MFCSMIDALDLGGNNERDVWPEETGKPENSFIARWLVDAWSDMQKFFCAARSLARYFLYIHSRFLRIPRGIGPKTLDFSPFLCFSSGSWRKYSFPVLASLVNDYSIRKKRNLKSGRIEVNQREYLNYLNFCLC